MKDLYEYTVSEEFRDFLLGRRQGDYLWELWKVGQESQVLADHPEATDLHWEHLTDCKDWHICEATGRTGASSDVGLVFTVP